MGMKYQIGDTQQPSVGNIPDRETQQSCSVGNIPDRETQQSCSVGNIPDRETQQSCSVGNIPDRETQQSCCVGGEDRETEQSCCVGNIPDRETVQSCCVGNIPDRETEQSCCVGDEDRETQQSCYVGDEIQYSENGIEIATEDAVGNHVADGVAVTQRSSTTSELLGGRLFMLCEVIVLASIMVVIVGLCLIPTIYYALPESTAVQVRTLWYLYSYSFQ